MNWDYHNEYIFNPYIFILMHDPSCILLKEGGKKIIYQNKAFPKMDKWGLQEKVRL